MASLVGLGPGGLALSNGYFIVHSDIKVSSVELSNELFLD